MSTEFVSLNEVFLPTTGGDIEGSLDVNGLLTVNDKSGNGTTYDVAAELSDLRAENDELKSNFNSVNDKLNEIFCKTRKLTTTVTAGENYSSVSGNAYLAGNILRLHISATRSSAVSGNITNETVCTYTINHGGRIKESFTIAIPTGATGGGGFLSIDSGTSNGETITLTLIAAAFHDSTTSFNSYFAVPVVLNLDAF